MNRLGLIWRLVRADLRDGLKGFRVFVLSLALGALVISAAGAAAQAFRDGLQAQSREILGGDALIEIPQRALAPEAQAWLAGQGRVARTIETRSMGQAGEVRRLVDVRGYGEGFPLLGAVELRGGGALAPLLARQPDGRVGAVVEPALLETFDLAVGDALRLGAGEVRITGVVEKEPDALGRGFALSPRVIVAETSLADLGLAGFGALYQTAYHVALLEGADLKDFRKGAEAASADFKGRIRDRDDAAPGLSGVIDQLESFLDFVGLAALLAGGIGVAGSVRGWLAAKRPAIATLKTLGASSVEIGAALLIQVALLATIASAVGAGLGALSPEIIAALAGDALPLKPAQEFYWGAALKAAGFATIGALAFSLAPIGAGRATPPSELYRGANGASRAPLPERLLGGVLALGLAAAMAAFSASPQFTAILAAAAFGAFLLLSGLGLAIKALARRGARNARGVWRLALSGLGGPGSLAPSAAPALGLGAALLCALLQAQANLVAQVEQVAPERAPSIVFTEIPAAQAQAFDAAVFAITGPLDQERYARAPIATARVAARNGAPIDVEAVEEGERWFVEGDLGVSTLAEAPRDQKILEGRFWPANAADVGEVSIEADAARGAGFKLGDRIGFEVAGAAVEATLTSLREVDWGGFGATFAVIFSPGVIDGAVTRHVAIARLDEPEEEAVVRALAKPFPTVTILRVRDALSAAAELFRGLKLAIQAVAGVAVAAGALAVAGAVAAGARRRVYEGAVLRAMGATRGQALAAVALELALTGAAAAGVGAVLGFAAAYPLITVVFEATWSLEWALGLTAVGAAALALGLAGAAAGLAALSDPPARTLKAERRFA